MKWHFPDTAGRCTNSGFMPHAMDVSKYQHTGDVCKPQQAKLQHREQKGDMAAHYEMRSHSHLRDGERESLKCLECFNSLQSHI